MSKLLLYPLKFGNMLMIIVFSLIFSFLFSTFKAGMIRFEPGFAIMFIMGLIAFFPFINGLFAHGLNIIESTVEGEKDPPVLQATALFSGRFLKQLAMLALFLVCAFLLARSGHAYSAIFILIFIAWVLPASLAIHSLYDNFMNMINPIILIRLIITLGLPYLISVVLLFPIVLIALSLPSVKWTQMLIQFPILLYLFLFFFRYLGLCLYRQRNILHKKVDFNEERSMALEKEQSEHKLNEGLLRAHDFVRAGDIEKAGNVIRPLVEVNSWMRFDHVFNIISKWKNPLPALDLTKAYIPFLLEQKHYMKALSLSEWSLAHDHSYTLSQNSNPGNLLEHAVTLEQFQTVAQLMSNYVQAYPSAVNATSLLLTAAGIHQEKLKNKVASDLLMQQLNEIDPEFFIKVSGGKDILQSNSE